MILSLNIDFVPYDYYAFWTINVTSPFNGEVLCTHFKKWNF